MRGTVYLISFLVVGLFAGSCSKFQKIRKSADWREKYDAALAYYEDKDYYRSSILFEEILPIIRGTPEAEPANFYYAYAHFYQDQFVMSSHYFKTFSDVYSRSEFAVEALYMYAYSLYKQSPDYSLDQTTTYEAISALQNFINRNPYSDYAKQADELINELQNKLERKAFENAKLFYKIRNYKAALVTFENYRKDYPDSKYNEEVSYLTILTAYEYARVSVPDKQKERFTLAITHYEKFIDTYPSSSFLKDAENIYVKSIEELSKFADQNNI